jgi:hypothetical protein
VSKPLKLSSGWVPTAFTRWSVCTMLVLTWECSVALRKHCNQNGIIIKIDEFANSTME